ncbi:hypothetical protein [Corallincola spongiicola]|uniref:Uncharacterized protein n=1 Tax=Corallincola spongiicola TaxID=2520508 RepID=A0ABY1WSR9_9GAMM|nr:hypothetical protein [Corallincola spongiicola]TAA47786.1 hypothetical protein EXY25_00605 [Corallincola spongiicola]
MKDHIAFYLIDEADYPNELIGSDEEKLTELVCLTQKHGIFQSELEVDRVAFMFGLEAIGACFGVRELIATLTFNYSPMSLLGTSPETNEAFGFINKVMSKDLFAALESRFSGTMDSVEPILNDDYYKRTSRDLVERICKIYLEVLSVASAKGLSVAVLHNQ